MIISIISKACGTAYEVVDWQLDQTCREELEAGEDVPGDSP